MTSIDPRSGARPTGVSNQRAMLDAHEEGYEKSLKPRQGAGARLQIAGPAPALVYLFCGAFAFLVLRALGELVMYSPTSGSFVYYAREFLGERDSFVAG